MTDAFLSGRWLWVGGMEQLTLMDYRCDPVVSSQGDALIWDAMRCELCYACVSMVAQLTSMIWYVIWCEMTVCYSICYNVLYCVLMRGDGGNSSLPLDGGSHLLSCPHSLPRSLSYPMTTHPSITTLSTSRAEWVQMHGYCLGSLYRMMFFIIVRLSVARQRDMLACMF